MCEALSTPLQLVMAQQMGGGYICRWGLHACGPEGYKQSRELQTVSKLWTSPNCQIFFPTPLRKVMVVGGGGLRGTVS